MLFFLRDQALVRLLSDSQVRVARARCNADLLEVLDRLDVFPGGLEFDHVQSIVLLVLAFASFATALLMDGMGGFFWVGLALAFFSYYTRKGLSGSLTDLATSIARKCALFCNELSEFDSTADWRLKKLNSEFAEYQRGNERRHIVDSVQGAYQGSRHRLAFEYHQLQYVTSSLQRGAGGSYRTVFETFNRYSLVVDFPWVTDIAVRSRPLEATLAGQPFKTDCNAFNEVFVLRGNDQASCERFVTPATLDLLLGLARHLDQPNLEFSSQGRLCLSFDNAQVMAHADLGALSDLSVFRERIEEGVELPGLFPVLEWVHQLALAHDSPTEDSELGELIKEG
ncbi:MULTISPECIES: hypothetical protein [unclassified Pseudomonas]|uniref:hypothetical protein n=1 Tax=unclassified Pseudomonas TaxID=196821 RepID=UPI0008393351|nr:MULTISPECIES: hypothetical protein [unclassified Pseudomonas]QIH09326.1 hypothetical protein ATY02_22745 [Pseudomonas sp. BIOMIG1BAC]